LHYDPIKLRLAHWLRMPFLRRSFHLALDLLFLRAWYVRRELRRISDFGFGISESDTPQSALRNPKLLDAGMGFGQYSDRLGRMFPGAKLVGLEIDRAHLYGGEDYFRRARPAARIVIGDVQTLPLAPEQFDLILTVDVMEHIPDDRATFAEFARVLKVGGLLMMHTPRVRDKGEGIRDKDTPPSPLPLAGGSKRGWEVGEHIRDGYRDGEARERLEAAGLEVVRMVHGYGKPGMVGWTLLQRIPMTMLGWSFLMIPLVVLFLIVALPAALAAMWLDYARGEHPDGGSLLVVARKRK